MKVTLHNKQCVKGILHKPSMKVIKAAARFIKYTGSQLRVSISTSSDRYLGRCQGRNAFKIKRPEYFARSRDELTAAIMFFETCCHELCHCQDAIEFRGLSNSGSRWSRKQCEIAVFDRLYDLTGGKARNYEHHYWVTQVKLPKYVQNAIMELAITYEEIA